MPLIHPQLKEMLICPHCHGELEEVEARSLLRCLGCGLGFGVADGLPNMLIDEAEQPEGFVTDANTTTATLHATADTGVADTDVADADVADVADVADATGSISMSPRAAFGDDRIGEA